MLIQCFGCLLERRLKKGLIFFLKLILFLCKPMCLCIDSGCVRSSDGGRTPLTHSQIPVRRRRVRPGLTARCL